MSKIATIAITEIIPKGGFQVDDGTKPQSFIRIDSKKPQGLCINTGRIVTFQKSQMVFPVKITFQLNTRCPCD